VAFAVNLTRVAGHTALADGDEVAFLPPLGGG
jgi:molybdopterin converting factor small subunit